MAYGEQDSVQAGLRFRTRSGVVVETTGNTSHVQSKAVPQGVYVHQVRIAEGDQKGTTFLCNLDYAEPA